LPVQGPDDTGMSEGPTYEYDYSYSYSYDHDCKFEIDPHQSEREAQLLQALEAARSQGMGTAQGQELDGSRPLCHFYSMGYCRSGDKCPYRHSTVYQGEYQARPGGNSLPPSLGLKTQGHLAHAVEHEQEVPSITFNGSSLLSLTPPWSSEVMPGPTLQRAKSWDLYGQDFQDWPWGLSSADADAGGSGNVDWDQVDGEGDVQQKSTCNGAGNDFGLPNEINFF
jgi:hypothetical protein